MKFELTILGSNAATPNFDRHPSAQILNVDSYLYLIDCGEGTQMRMLDFKISKSKIKAIFISHLHGDHVLGLGGLLNTFSLLGRKKELKIFGPPQLKEFLELQLKYTYSHLTYDLQIVSVNPTQFKSIYQDNKVEVFTFPLQHRIPCCGYLFKETERPPNINMEAATHYKVEYSEFSEAKNKLDVLSTEGKVIPYHLLLKAPYQRRSYAYCSDTSFKPDLVKFIDGVDLLYHESTFLHEAIDKAEKTGHSTARQAGEIAKLVNAGKLILGHFSSRYTNLEILKEEAKQVFPSVELGIEGKVFKVALIRKEK